MKRIWEFNNEFLESKIIEGEKLLQNPNISEEQKIHIGFMISNFNDYLGEWTLFKSGPKLEVPLSEKCKQLSEKLNRDLKKLNLNYWNAMYSLCERGIAEKIKEPKILESSFSGDEIVTNALEFYRNFDRLFYSASKDIINNPNSLINLTYDKSIEDHCFKCDYLGLPFINVQIDNDASKVWFVHELQHGVDYLLYKNIPYFFSELSSMFLETIYIDEMTEKQKYNYYLHRLKDNFEQMNLLYEYINVLHLFIENNYNINSKNVYKILNCQSEQGAINKCSMLLSDNFLEIFQYILSFTMSLELRESYYNNKKGSLKKLKGRLAGNNINVDFDVLETCFNNYLEEINQKCKTKNRR